MTQVILILLFMFGGALSSQPQTKTPSRAMAVTMTTTRILADAKFRCRI
jgi:hypothetical protein